ncbi:MAG: malonyl-ACP O-methyltransferase BioC [Legionellales bacterium]|nr:malonyl-ACP O-methyltransferase BioC [Legionellales bacterium]
MKVITEISKAFDKVAAQYDALAKIQKEIGERLFKRLDWLKINPRFILDVGCGPGYFSERLQKQFPKATVVGLDLAYGMVKQAKGRQSWWHPWPLVNADMLSMPFATSAFDLIFANQVIHWSPSLNDAMRELNRVMNVSGCLMFSTLGPDTFIELREAWALVDSNAHVNDFKDMHDIGDCLMTEHFLDPVVDRELLKAHYSSLPQLLTSLKAQGVRNIHAARPSGLTGRHARSRFERAFSTCCTPEGRYPLTYDVVYGHAWKGTQRRLLEGTETRVAVSSVGVKNKAKGIL